MYSKNKNKGVKISLIVAFFAALLGCMIAFVCNPFGVSKEASGEITAPEKLATSAIAGGETSDNGGIYAPEREAKATSAATMAAAWETAVNNNGTFTLTENWTASSGSDGFGTSSSYYMAGGLYVPAGKTVTINLNGRTLDRNNPSSSSSVITVAGTLTINDTGSTGKITGGNGGYYYSGIKVDGGNLTLNGGTITGNTSSGGSGATYGGGVGVFDTDSSSATFTMNGGTISGNTLSRGRGGGVGIYATHENSATFTMNGGTISGNYSDMGGGGVAMGGYEDSHAIFIMTGGTITGNTNSNAASAQYSESGHGGGVFADGGYGTDCVLKLSGTPKIYGNTSTGTNSDVYLENACITITGKLVSGANVVIDTQGVITSGYSDFNTAAPSNFFSSTHNISVLLFNGEVCISSNTKSLIWAAAVSKSVQTGTQQTVTLTENWTAATDTTYKTSFGGGIGFANGSLVVPKGANIVLDLNGCKLNRNLTSTPGSGSSESGCVIVVSQGTLEITDNSASQAGTITGAYGYYGGVAVMYGNLILKGGTISGNTASGYGGGVSVAWGTFTMYGGTISGNTASSKAGGVYASGDKFTMYGGTITGNKASSGGGGVYVDSTFEVSGNVQITDNKRGTTTSSPSCDVEFYGSYKMTVIGALTGSKIGIYGTSTTAFTRNYSTYNSGVKPSAYFFSNSGKTVLLSSNEAVLGTDTATQLTWKYSTVENGTYSNVPSSGTITYTGIIYYVKAYNGTTEVSISSRVYKNADGSTESYIKNAGTYTCTVNSDSYSNPAFTLTILPKALTSPTITLGTSSYTYNGSAKTPTVSSVLDGTTTIPSGSYTVSYSNNINASTSATVTLVFSGNYTGTVNKTFTISPKALSSATITLGTSSYTYDGTAKTPTVSSVKDGSTTITTYAVAYSNNINAGTSARVTITFSGNYSGTVNKSFTIEKASLSSAAVTFGVSNYTYTGSAISPVPTVTLSSKTLAQNVDFTAAYSNNTNAGTNATVTVTGTGNYTGTATGKFTIDQRQIFVAGIKVADKEYDGTTSATVDMSAVKLVGVIEADKANLGLTFTEGSAFDGASVGLHGVTITGVTLTGTAAGNYILEADEVTGYAQIYPKTITISGVAANNKTYDGTTAVTFDVSGATLTGVIADELTGLTLSAEGYFNTKNAGEGVAVTVISYKLTGDKAGNYYIDFANSVQSLTADIAKAEIEVTLGKTEYTVTYGNALKITYTQNSPVSSESVALDLEYYDEDDAKLDGVPTDAGSYLVKVVVDSDDTNAVNYTVIEAEAPVTIEKATLTVTVEDLEIEYGSEVPTTDDYTLIYSGWLNGDAASVTPSVTVNTTYERGNNVGDYELTVTAGELANYDIVVSDDNGVLWVVAKKVTVKIDDQTSVYGAAEAELTSNGTAEMNITLEREEGTDVGKYVISGDWDNDNYDITFINGVYEITKATLTVTATADDITYGEAMANNGVDYDGFVNDDGENDLNGELKFLTNYRQFAKVGTYNISAYGLTSKNYNIEYADGTFEVAPRAISIVISEDNKSVYGEDLAEIKWTLADGSETIVNGDKLDITFTIDYANISSGLPYGEYDVTGTDNDENYEVTFTNTGKYTVSKATLTVITNNATSVYGTTPAGNGVTYKGLVDGDESALTVSLTYLFHNNATDKETVEQFNVGTYAILAQGVSSDNYEVEYEYGVLTVTPAKATVKIDKIEAVYGEEEQELTFKVDGLVNGDDKSVLNVALTRIEGDDAGTYAITGSANAENYTVDIEGSLYVIKPYEITSITWKGQETADASKEFIYTYNGNPQGPTATYTGADGEEHDLIVYGHISHTGVDFIAEAVLPGAKNFTLSSSVDRTHKFTIQAKEVSAIWYFNQGGNKVQVTESTPCKLEYISGIAQAPYAELDGVLDGDTVTVEILGKGISVNNYVAKAIITDNTNYVIKVSTSTCDYAITAKAPSGFNWYKATGDSTPAVSGAVSYTFDGLAHQPVVVSGSGDAYSYKITLADGTDCGNVAINAGSYVIVATPVDNDYTITAAQARFEFTITPKVVTISWSGLTVEYNGAVQLPTASYETALDGEQNLTVKCDDETKDADTYTVYVTLPSNYSLADGTTGRIENTFKIEQKVIEVTWTSKLEDGEWKMVYDGTDVADRIEAQASMDSIAEADGVPELLYTISKDGEDGLNEIKDAGEYTIAVSLASSNPNYVVNHSSKTFNVSKKNLQITAESTQATIEYNAPRPNFTAEFDGFVDGENAIDLGLLNDSEIVTSAFRWLDTNYSVGKGPAVYEVILTGDAETLKKFYEILKNYDVEFIKGEFEVEAAEGNVWLIGGTHVYDGNGYLPEAYYKAGSDTIQLEVILVAGDYKVDENGKPVNEGTYEITVAKRADDTTHAGVELDKLDWTFTITVRDIIVEILNTTLTYGDESTKQTNYSSAITYNFKDLAPVEGDDIGLDVSVSGITFDAGEYANSGVYVISGSWNENAEVSANYNVTFVGSEGESGKFTVNKARITVNNSQNEYDQEAVISGKRIEVTVGKHIEFVGYGDATVTIGYSDVYSLDDYDLTDIPADKNGNYSNNKVDLASYGAGKWFVNCKISIPNHEDEYVQWRIIVLPKDQYIQIIFVKEYEVYYGGTLADGSEMPEGNELAKALYNGGYIDKEHLEGMEENFLTYASARVVADSVNTAKVGSYSIVIEGFDKIPTTGNKVYQVTYKADLSDEDAIETNVNKFVVLKRQLTVEWGETTFDYDGEKHMPAPVISGWASKQTLTLDDGAKAYVFTDEVTGAEVTVTLSATGDFTTAGQPNLMTVIIDNSNYAIDAENASCAVNIKPVDDITPAPAKEGGIPGWAIGVIATLAAVTVVMIIAFAVVKGKGKPVSDADGFYDDVDENS